MYFGRVKMVKTERNETPFTAAQIHAPSTSKVQFKELSSGKASLQTRGGEFTCFEVHMVNDRVCVQSGTCMKR